MSSMWFNAAAAAAAEELHPLLQGRYRGPQRHHRPQLQYCIVLGTLASAGGWWGFHRGVYWECVVSNGHLPP